MKAKEYLEKNYGQGHLQSVMQLDDILSIFALMDEFAEYKVKNCNAPDVSVALPTQSELQETVEKIAYNQLAEEQIDDLVCKMQILDEFVKKYLKAVGNEC